MLEFWKRTVAPGFAARGRSEAQGLVKENVLRGQGGGGGLFGGFRNGAGNVGSMARSASGNLAVLALGAFRSEPAEPLPTDETDTGVRFKAAQAHFGRDTGYVHAIQDNKYRTCILYLSIAIALLTIDVATWHSYSSSWMLVLGHISPLIPALLLAFVAAFHNWQARTRRLSGMLAFARMPGQWWPHPSVMSSVNGTARSVATMVLLVGGGIAGLITGTAPDAHAQAVANGAATVSGMFANLPATDLWGKLLTFVFPGIGPIGGTVSPVSNGIAGGFSAMIAVLMAVSAAMMGFQTVVATASTAHDGELLGRRWHSLWAPIRVCYGFAALAPIVKGYCLLQILAIWMAVASGQLGNAMWTGFVTNLPSNTIATPNLQESLGVVKDELRMEVCFATLETYATNTGGTSPTWPTDGVSTGTGINKSQFWDWITSFWSNTANTVAPYHISHLVWSYGPCGTISGDYADAAAGTLGTMAQAQRSAVNTMRSSLRTVAKAIVASVTPSEGSVPQSLDSQFAPVVSAKTAFDSAMTTAAAAFVNSASSAGSNTTDFQNAATSAGWASAGSYYMTIARINTAQVAAARNMPVVNAGTTDQNLISGPLRDALTAVPFGALPVFEAWWDTNMKAANATFSNSAVAAGTMETSGIYFEMKDVGSTDSWLQQKLMNQVKLDPANFSGLQQMIDLGDYIIGLGESIVGTMVAAKIATVIPALKGAAALKAITAGSAGSGLLDGPLSFATLFIGTIGTALMAAGVYDSLVLPMMPYMHFTFATMGILVVVVEAVIAGPLWAFCHIRMEGSELFEQTQLAGYKILFNLLFRIPLTLLGLFFSYLVFNAMVWLLSVTLYPAMAAATADSLFGVVGTIAYIVLITGMNYGVANRSFALIHEVPGRVTRWFGASEGGDESNHVNAAIGMIKGHSSSAMSGLRQGAMGAGAGSRGKTAGNQDANAGKNQRERANSISDDVKVASDEKADDVKEGG